MFETLENKVKKLTNTLDKQNYVNDLIENGNLREIAKIVADEELSVILENQLKNIFLLLPIDSFSDELNKAVRSKLTEQFTADNKQLKETIKDKENDLMFQTSQFEEENKSITDRKQQVLYESKNINKDEIEQLSNELNELQNDINLTINNLKNKYSNNPKLIEENTQHLKDLYTKKVNELDDFKAQDAKRFEDEFKKITSEAESKIQKLEGRLNSINKLKNEINDLNNNQKNKLDEHYDKLDANIASNVLKLKARLIEPESVLQSLLYLASVGKMSNGLKNVLANDYDQKNIILTQFAKIQIYEGRFNEMISDVGIQPLAIRNQFAGRIFDAIELIVKEGKPIDIVELEESFKKLNVDKDIFNTRIEKFLSKSNFVLALLCYNLGGEQQKSFSELAFSKINDYQALIKVYSQIGDSNGALGKQLGSALMDKGSEKGAYLLKSIMDELNKVENGTLRNINEKVNLASILSDAHKFISNSKLSDDEKKPLLKQLDDIYQGHIAAKGSYELGTIMKKYSEEGIYSALKIATHNLMSSKLPVPEDSLNTINNIEKDSYLNAILYAPSLEMFDKTKMAVTKLLGEESKGLTFAEIMMKAFAPILKLFAIMPDPKQLIDAAAYIVGAKNNLNLSSAKSEEISNIKQIKSTISNQQPGAYIA